MEDNIIKEQEQAPREEAKITKEEKVESEVVAESVEKPKTTRGKTTDKPKSDEDSSATTEKKPRTRKSSSASGTKKSSQSAKRESNPIESVAEVENTEKAPEAVDITPEPIQIDAAEATFPGIVITVPEVIKSTEAVDVAPDEAVVGTAVSPIESLADTKEALADTAKNPVEASVDAVENSTEAESESSIDESELTAESEQNPSDDDGEEDIIPPDELFAYRAKPAIEPEEVEQEVLEEVQEATLAPVEEGVASEEDVDGDGQYQFTDLEPLPSQTEEKPEPKLEKYDPKRPRSIDKRFDLVELFVFTLLAVMIITTFFFRHSIVDGDSMVDTLHNGEHLIISDFFYTPKRGDIIVCEDYSTSLKKPIVKRVIAIEGDTVEVKAGEVRVNGKLLDESDYLYIDGIDVTKPVSLTVPENEIFVMGDHRNDSEDSRSIGTISEDAVLGKVILRFYPFDKFGPVN